MHLHASLSAFSNLFSLCVIHGFWSAVAPWINLICIFNTVCSLPPKWNQRMPGEFIHVLMNLLWRPHLISELSMTQAMWLFPICLLLVGKQQVDVWVFFSPYITFKKSAIHLRSYCHPRKCFVIHLLMSSKSTENLCLWTQNFGHRYLKLMSLMVTILLKNFISCDVLSSSCWRLQRVWFLVFTA